MNRELHVDDLSTRCGMLLDTIYIKSAVKITGQSSRS